MTRKIELHPLSLVVGLGLAVLGVVAMGQSLVPNRPALEPSSMFGQVAHPRDWVVIEEGLTYVVPPSRILVLTALGSVETSNTEKVRISVDGSQVAATTLGGAGSGASLKSLPVGLAVRAGSAIDVLDGLTAQDARAWGYLVDA